MKTTATFSILFWADLPRAKEDQASIYARITVNGKRATISLKRKVPIQDWDAHKGRARGINQNARALNNYLEEANSHFFKCYQDLKLEGKLITSQVVKARYLGEDEQNHSINDIISYHKEDMDGKLKWGTQKNYYTTQKYLAKFMLKTYRTTDMYLRELDYNFIIKFEKHLRNHMPEDHQKPMGNNTVMKHIERLRKLVNLAFKLGWIDRDPFVNFKAQFIKTERCFLSPEELRSLEKKQFSIERLQLVKDLFVFSCYTSLSYIDVINLSEDNINIGIDGKLWIHYKREKTTKVIRIPLLPKALGVIETYKGKQKNKSQENALFPNISNQKLNAYLKEIADLCGIKKNLTFHIARHTFATTVMLSNGVPIETVSKLLGHAKLSTTQVYARVVEAKISEDIQNLLIRFDAQEQQSQAIK
ncbi:site-specific recombinase XerD [Mariniflexile fucanivorans]|uniref:Site-specific recombinase XerD n=1 Tax=Mariniflexile fucanivorans TaxID=264023 RepID=A0A4V2QDD9_9FLAO|nr:site-specific integrase [Mariniflexile fucanivorans]TCL64037.1 site-specific recombinase XerD [Mariniflexile fucanivorans]